MTGTNSNKTTHHTGAEDHATLEPEEARQATRGNGIWIILTASTALAVAVLLVMFGGAMG